MKGLIVPALPPTWFQLVMYPCRCSTIWAPVSAAGACEATEPETAMPRVSRANGKALRPPATSVAFCADEERAKVTSGLLPAPKRSALPAPEPTGRVMAVDRRAG